MPNNLNLRRLTAIRAVILGLQIVARYIAEAKLGWMLPYVTLDILFSALLAFILFSWWRSYRPWPVTDPEMFVHYTVDVTAFAAVLYFSGGASNPFISYLLVPLCLAAASLPWLYTWLLGALCLLVYSTLLYRFVPLTALAPQHHHGENNLHIIGMWLNFLVSAALISYFVFKMASQLREREQELASIRERQLQNDQLLAVAALAAGTAHELGTPLSGIKVISEDLQDALADSDLREDLNALNTQVDACSRILGKLVQTARELGDHGVRRINARDFFAEVLEQFRILRPTVNLTMSLSESLQDRLLRLDGTLSQSIISLLNNAADVSPEDVSLEADLHHDDLVIAIYDRGPGLSESQRREMRKAFVSTKGKGMGLGLFLSHASAERYGGSLRWLARDGGGSRLELRLPRARILEHD